MDVRKLTTIGLSILGILGWILAVGIVFSDYQDKGQEVKALIDENKAQQVIIVDILSKEVDAVVSKCSKKSGKDIKWTGQFYLVDKYCKLPILNSNIHIRSQCQEIKKCLPSKQD
ncbi:DUF2608 domain-containing protein [Photobacterium indicum]|jgi:hypothetical protein|uniref:Uncharacterized protein n=1 Tax=Photobacterium indicum TaxID=81447 RepID=A0A2T3LBT0_9GAMM|nr:DUF2608 domain-containing protein [Photobacterium indicum]PSV48790.1 hypothetical protein C9J47_09810 [Photobacterium indicum]